MSVVSERQRQAGSGSAPVTPQDIMSPAVPTPSISRNPLRGSKCNCLHVSSLASKYRTMQYHDKLLFSYYYYYYTSSEYHAFVFVLYTAFSLSGNNYITNTIASHLLFYFHITYFISNGASSTRVCMGGCRKNCRFLRVAAIYEAQNRVLMFKKCLPGNVAKMSLP